MASEDEYIQALIEAVEKRPVLYNIHLGEYKNKNKKGEAFKEVQLEVRKAGCSEQQVQGTYKKWISLKRKFRVEFLKVRDSLTDDTDEANEKSSYKFYNNLKFLIPYCEFYRKCKKATKRKMDEFGKLIDEDESDEEKYSVGYEETSAQNTLYQLINNENQKRVKLECHIDSSYLSQNNENPPENGYSPSSSSSIFNNTDNNISTTLKQSKTALKSTTNNNNNLTKMEALLSQREIEKSNHNLDDNNNEHEEIFDGKVLSKTQNALFGQIVANENERLYLTMDEILQSLIPMETEEETTENNTSFKTKIHEDDQVFDEILIDSNNDEKNELLETIVFPSETNKPEENNVNSQTTTIHDVEAYDDMLAASDNDEDDNFYENFQKQEESTKLKPLSQEFIEKIVDSMKSSTSKNSTITTKPNKKDKSNEGTLETLIDGDSIVKHTKFAYSIDERFYPMHLTPFQLKYFHRMPLSKRLIENGIGDYLSITIIPNNNLNVSPKNSKSIENFSQIKNLEQLSGANGNLLLMEYLEQYPILLSQTGMASKIFNYYSIKEDIMDNTIFNLDNEDMDHKYGETILMDGSPFLGDMKSGKGYQVIENNMFRSVIFQHRPKPTDYLLIITKNGLFLRKFPDLFVVGQQFPSLQVPFPVSRITWKFSKNALLCYIYRLFAASKTKPRSLRSDIIKNAFGNNLSENVVYKRLRTCANFNRNYDENYFRYWELRDDFVLPSEDEIQAMLTPEMCCAHYSMLAAEFRLTLAGYANDKFLIPKAKNAKDSDNDDDDNEGGGEEDDSVKIEDEINCAPWKTSKAFINAMKGECVLDRTGIADPTGSGLGFSFVRVPRSYKQKVGSEKEKNKVEPIEKSDLRKLTKKEAQNMCQNLGVSEAKINDLTRWQLIDLIRAISTNSFCTQNFELKELHKFARNIHGGLSVSNTERLNLKLDFQRIFDLQNQMLTNSKEAVSDLEIEDIDDIDENDLEYIKERSNTCSNSHKTNQHQIISNEEEEYENSFNSNTCTTTTTTSSSSSIVDDEINISSRKAAINKEVDVGHVKVFVVKNEEDNNDDFIKSGQPSQNGNKPTTSKQIEEKQIPLWQQTRQYEPLKPISSMEIDYDEEEMKDDKIFNFPLPTEKPEKIAILKIIRSFKKENSQEILLEEAVMDPKLIAAYLNIRSTRDSDFIRNYAYMDAEYKYEVRKAKRRLQDKQRRAKRNQIKLAMGIPIFPQTRNRKPKMAKPINPNILRLRCSACDAKGHMKTNRNCPLYVPRSELRKRRLSDNSKENLKTEELNNSDNDDDEIDSCQMGKGPINEDYPKREMITRRRSSNRVGAKILRFSPTP